LVDKMIVRRQWIGLIYLKNFNAEQIMKAQSYEKGDPWNFQVCQVSLGVSNKTLDDGIEFSLIKSYF